MIIQEVIIENYLCYYDLKKFVFSNGLNIILGENGEGKTKFFEAIDWLFKGDTKQLELLVSAKKLDEVSVGESFRVRVSIVVKQYNENRILTRQFSVKKTGANECDVSNPTLEGIEENNIGERNQVDGIRLMESLFPSTIRKYSMFKGEAALDIFEDSDTLITLINAFSEAKHYDKYSIKGEFLKSEAEKAVDVASRNAIKNQAHYNNLDSEIKRLEQSRNREKTFLDSTQDQIIKLREHIADAANYVSNAADLEIVNKRIEQIKIKINTANSHISENYTTSLFDDGWILMNYEGLHSDFRNKITALSSTRRELQSEFDIQNGIKIGERRAQIRLLNNAIPLPTTVPSRAIMEEMLSDELCKVCNRPAKKDSEAFNFMLSRLEEYIKSQVPNSEDSEEQDQLFTSDYTTKLVNLATTHDDNLSSIREIRSNIEQLFQFNEKLRADIEKLEGLLEKEIEERIRILGNSILGESRLIDTLKNYNTWHTDLSKLEKDEDLLQKEVESLTYQLEKAKAEKDTIDTQNANTFLIKTRTILRDICTIFKDTRESKFDEFIASLQNLSNEYFSRINAGAFTGYIVFTRRTIKGNPAVSIELQEEGRTLYKPNQSLLTSMHISILFAISQLASEKNEESYPMIFDAPTSSFGETKTGAFLNIICETENQIILLLKDFIAEDKESKNLFIKPDFADIKKNKAFWVRLERPFNKHVLKTINTEIITL